MQVRLRPSGNPQGEPTEARSDLQHQSEPARHFECKFGCGKSTTRKGDQKRHEAICTLNQNRHEAKQHGCSFGCGHLATTKENLQSHESDASTTCKDCGRLGGPRRDRLCRGCFPEKRLAKEQKGEARWARFVPARFSARFVPVGRLPAVPLTQSARACHEGEGS